MYIVNFLKEQAQKGFFVESQILKSGNVTTISNDKYEFKVDDSKMRISITRKTPLKLPIPLDYNSAFLKINKIAAMQEHRKSGVNRKEVKKIYVKEILNLKPNMFNMLRVSNRKVDEVIKEAKKHMRQFRKLEIQWCDDKRNYKLAKKEETDFLLSIKNELNILKNTYVVETELSNQSYRDLIGVNTVQKR